jgi:hypothetical protein
LISFNLKMWDSIVVELTMCYMSMENVKCSKQ